MDALSVVVNSNNPVNELTLKQVLGIYTGAINNWSEVGGSNAPIVRYCRESNSGTYVFFKEHVLKNKDYAADCQTMPGTGAVAEAVSQDPNGIGYGGVAYFMTRSDSKILAIKKDENAPAIHPVKNGKIDFHVVYSGDYPIGRYLNCYTLGSPEGDVQEYMSWILGPQGQQIAEEVGYIPLPA
jgi:phosphate transport system substrate-binding protein